MTWSGGLSIALFRTKNHIIENIYMSILLGGIMITVLRAAARNWNTTPQANFCPDSRTSERKIRLAAGQWSLRNRKRKGVGIYLFIPQRSKLDSLPLLRC
jgi:hypothetical protein